MMIHRISSTILYHGSRKQFPDGFVLTPQNDGYVSGGGDEFSAGILETERFLEGLRPADKLARHGSVFLVDNPDDIDFAGGYTDYIYKVQPIGEVQRSDMAWYSDLDVHFHDIQSRTQCAKNYWAGVPYTNAPNSLWEYRTASARIISEVQDV